MRESGWLIKYRSMPPNANTLLIGVELDEAEIALCVSAGKAAIEQGD